MQDKSIAPQSIAMALSPFYKIKITFYPLGNLYSLKQTESASKLNPLGVVVLPLWEELI